MRVILILWLSTLTAFLIHPLIVVHGTVVQSTLWTSQLGFARIGKTPCHRPEADRKDRNLLQRIDRAILQQRMEPSCGRLLVYQI
jgi:hypothetical protein